MKKLLALLLCVVMVASVLVGCKTPAGPDDDVETTTRKGLKAPDGYTLTIGLPVNAMVEDHQDNALTKWLEEQSGYKIKIVKYQSAAVDYKSQIATQFEVPGQRMPDLLIGPNLGHITATEYGQKGRFIELGQYFNDKEYSQQWWDRLESIDDEDFITYVKKRLFVEESGEVYYFPTIEYNMYDMIKHSAFINQEWLDRLGLPMPTNKDELYNTLKAFKEKDANGNGDPSDEIPLLGMATGAYGDVISWIANMFGYFEEARPWRVDAEGNISGIYWTEEYREALIFMNKLMKEGLIPANIFTITQSELSNLVNPTVGEETVGVWLGHPSLVINEGSDAVYVYKAMPQWGYAIMSQPVFTANCYITRDCEYPDAAWEILMLLSSQEGSYRLRYGDKGVDWDYADPGTKAFTGLDAEIKVLNQTLYGSKNKSCWNNISGAMGLANENERTQLSENDTAWNKAKLNMMSECFKNNWNRFEAQGGRPADTVMPLVFTAEEEKECWQWRDNSKSWFISCRADFIKGIKDPSNDAHWQDYIKGFETQNYEDWKEMAKHVYNMTYGDKAGK
ncbi:MAG: extracellular solute-binding protein [Oscillospiraceae bacterium]|nr:extracellular solute-binding protein [Oscillospiraceae bacterium]